jgi:cell wall-associated NlpC family hydrolase
VLPLISDALRAAIVAEAKTWYGTKYHICAGIKGKGGGVDCFQLLYRVFKHVGLMPERTWDYKNARSFITDKNPLYLRTIMEFADEVPETNVLPGDVVMYKNSCFPVFTHAAIVLNWPVVIHAAIGQGVIITAMDEGFLSPWLRKVFRFRGNS